MLIIVFRPYKGMKLENKYLFLNIKYLMSVFYDVLTQMQHYGLGEKTPPQPNIYISFSLMWKIQAFNDNNIILIALHCTTHITVSE